MNRFCSLFSHILKFIPRTDLEGEVRTLNAERHARGVSCWQRFVSMIYCELGCAHSLREIAQGLRSCEGKLSHLGIEMVSRSSLSYVNGNRPRQLSQNVFHLLYSRCQAQLAQPGGWKIKNFRFKKKLVSLDSSVIDLCVSMYDWTKFRTTKGESKLHLLLDHDGYLRSLAVITIGKVSDVTVAKTLKLQPGTIIVDDRGYNDYELFGRWTDEGVYFVARLKDNAVYQLVKTLPVPGVSNSNVRKDQLLRFRRAQAKKRCPHELRLVSFYDPEQKRESQFLTNNFRFAAKIIAAIYKDRCAVELSFKALTQNLKIKTFVGTSPTAVKAQVWTALITMLMLRLMQLKSRWGWSTSDLVALLRINLFTQRELWAWLDNPFAVSPDPPRPEQVIMAF